MAAWQIRAVYVQGNSVFKKMAQPHELFRFLKNKKMALKLSTELS